MHKWETRMLLKHYLDQGFTKAELSRRFGVDRRTIHNWVRSGQLDRDLAAGEVRYRPRPPVARKLDPYSGIIESRLEAHPKLSAQRLFDEIRKAGYDGGYSQVRDHVRSVRPRAPEEEPVRFETPPGRQGQVDFGSFRFPWGRRHALVVVLGHSRLLWVRFYASQTMAVLTEGSSARSRPSAGPDAGRTPCGKSSIATNGTFSVAIDKTALFPRGSPHGGSQSGRGFDFRCDPSSHRSMAWKSRRRWRRYHTGTHILS